MFKFRSSLVQQLWRYVQCPLEDVEQLDHLASTATSDDQRPLHVRRSSTSISTGKKKQIQTILMRLKKTNLETLYKAVSSKGADPGPCVMIPCTSSTTAGVAANVLLSQIFRWPDLQSESELKRLAFCHTLSDQEHKIISDFKNQPKLYECCNPYHWSRILKPSVGVATATSFTDIPVANTKGKQEEDMVISYATNGSTYGSQDKGTWCQLAYWEECHRVGRLYPVTASTIEVFSALPKAVRDGLCLASLFKQNKRPSESTTRTREKIGQGILLNYSQDQGVWLYNRTENAIFVNSPTLEPSFHSNYPFTVIKVLPGYSIQVFDYEKSSLYERLRDNLHAQEGPFDPYSIRISFVKGWGTNYSRQVVTNCPCWLEVLLTTVPPPHR